MESFYLYIDLNQQHIHHTPVNSETWTDHIDISPHRINYEFYDGQYRWKLHVDRMNLSFVGFITGGGFNESAVKGECSELKLNRVF